MSYKQCNFGCVMKKNQCSQCQGKGHHNDIIIGKSAICPECGGTGSSKGQGNWKITSQEFKPNLGFETWENTKTKAVAKHLIMPGLIRTFLS